MPRISPPPHSSEHWQRLREEVARVVDEVPLYQALWAGRPAPPASDDPAALSAWLAEMPAVSKRELRRGFPKSLVRKGTDLKAEMARGAVEIIATSGTTENRLQVLWEWSWWDPQEREAMRLNRRVAEIMPRGDGDGGKPFREAVLTTPVCGGATCHVGNLSREERTIDGMLFLNQVADPSHWGPAELERMVAEWNDLRPDGVESDPVYLAHLCRHAQRAGVKLHSPGFVTLTYELPTRAHKRQIARVLDTPLYALYGATEAGVLFMECERGRLHHNARHSHVELEPLDGFGDGLHRVLVTTLGRTWMPLLRYELGDVVRVAEQPCACGLPESGYLLERVEGRLADCVEGAGRRFTPAELDDAIDQAAPALESWQLEREAGGWLLKTVGDSGAEAAAAALERTLGQPVTTRAESAILPEPSGKYRLTRPA